MPNFTLIHYAVRQVDGWHYVVWGGLFLLTLLLIRAILRQNYAYATLVNEGASTQTVVALFYLGKARGMVVIVLWCLLCLLFIYHDLEKEIERVRTHPSMGVSITPEPPPIKPSIPTSKPIGSAEEQLDMLKSSYEDAFVSYLILDGCKQANLRDYEAIYLALLTALKPFDDTGKIAGNIIIAASGTYQGLYHNAPCDKSYLNPIIQNLEQFKQSAAVN